MSEPLRPLPPSALAERYADQVDQRLEDLRDVRRYVARRLP